MGIPSFFQMRKGYARQDCPYDFGMHNSKSAVWSVESGVAVALRAVLFFL
jgi:hypothetical protein